MLAALMAEAGYEFGDAPEAPLAQGNLPPLPAPNLGPEGLPAGISIPPSGVNQGRGEQ